jgi:hypothetical protein
MRSAHAIGHREDGVMTVKIAVVRVHALETIVHGLRHIDPWRWHPLIYNLPDTPSAWERSWASRSARKPKERCGHR